MKTLTDRTKVYNALQISRSQFLSSLWIFMSSDLVSTSVSIHSIHSIVSSVRILPTVNHKTAAIRPNSAADGNTAQGLPYFIPSNKTPLAQAIINSMRMNCETAVKRFLFDTNFNLDLFPLLSILIYKLYATKELFAIYLFVKRSPSTTHYWPCIF